MFTEEAQKYLGFLLNRDSETDFKIKHGTEMYRKGFGHFILRDHDGKEIPAATIKLKQKSHEYKFGCNAFLIGPLLRTPRHQGREDARSGGEGGKEPPCP